MEPKVILIEPYSIYEPKEELSKKINKNLSAFQKQRKVLKKYKRQNVLKNIKKQEIRSEKSSDKKCTNFSIDLQTLPSPEELKTFIYSCMEIQQGAYEAAYWTNRDAELVLLFIFLEAFISIVFNCYYMISVLVEPKAFKLPMGETIDYLAQHLIQPILCVLMSVLSYSILKREFRKTQNIVNKLIIHIPDSESKARFMAFSQQLQGNIPEFSVFGFFHLDGSVIFSMISATTTYLIILVQALGSQSEVDPFFEAFQGDLNKTEIN